MADEDFTTITDPEIAFRRLRDLKGDRDWVGKLEKGDFGVNKAFNHLSRVIAGGGADAIRKREALMENLEFKDRFKNGDIAAREQIEVLNGISRSSGTYL